MQRSNPPRSGSRLTSIAHGDYPAGSRLPLIEKNAIRTGVSRPTAREALLALELVGAVGATAMAPTHHSEHDLDEAARTWWASPVSCPALLC